MEVNYQSLLEWRIKEGLPDQWLISIQGTVSQELFSLDQIKQMHTNSPSTSISVLNINHQNTGNQWYLYRDISNPSNDGYSIAGEKVIEDEKGITNREIIGCGWILAICIPLAGFMVALVFFFSETRKKHAPKILITSILVQISAIIIVELIYELIN